MLGGKVNFFFEGKALTGLFAGPELYYYGGSITAKNTDMYGTPYEYKTELSVITAGGHIGYRLILDGGLSIDGILSVNYIRSGNINFNGTPFSFGLVLPTLGANAGYAF